MEFAKAVNMRNFFTDLKNFMRRKTSGGKILLRREDGNVESSLVLIPLLILFLICMELIIASIVRCDREST